MIKKMLIAPLIVGASMLVVGSTIAGISAAAAGGFHFLSTAEPYIERVVDVTSENVNINVYEQNNEIVVNESLTATTVSVSVYENDYEYYVTNETASDFTITYHEVIPWNVRLFYFSLTPRTMTITIPVDYDGSLNINTTNAVIDVNEISIAGELKLESINGYVTIDNVDVGEDILVQTTNSKIEVNNSTVVGDVQAHSQNALIKLLDVTADNVDAQTTNGKIQAETMHVANKMSLTTTNGQVAVSDIDVGEEIRLVTTNGEVSGNVKGPSSDYDVNSQTTNGTNNLAGYNDQTPTTNDKILYVRTYNGVINITFR
ncbi:MAG: hypothetical protein EOM77_01605 [Bacteroidia bacterium]|nr:hypothetical protein [Bacteroidia bacterium]